MSNQKELNKKWLKDELKEFSYSNEFFDKILDLLSKQYINGLEQSRFEKNLLEQENKELEKQLSNSHQIKMKRLQQENKKLKEQLETSEKARKESMRILGEYRHYTLPTEEQNRENEDIVDKAYNNLILKQDINKGE